MADGAGRPLVSIREVAEQLGLPESRVYDLVRRGQLAAIQMGKRRYVSPKVLDEFLGREGGGGQTPVPLSAEPASTESCIQTIGGQRYLVSYTPLGGAEGSRGEPNGTGHKHTLP